MSLLALGAQLGGSLLQHSLNQRSQKKAFEQNVQFWQNKFDQTNAYNHPVQQMARMKQAGLNPALMYGQSATGATGTAQSQSSEGAKAAQMSGGMNQLGLMSLQAEQIKADTLVKQQDASLRGVQVGTELARKAKTWAEAKTAENLSEFSYDMYTYQFKEQMYRAIDQQISTEIKDATKREEIASILSDAKYKAAKALNEQNEAQVFNETREQLRRAGINPAMIINLIKILK
jgi:hypothetical protein